MKTNSQEVQELLIEAQRKAWTSKPKILKVTQKKDLDYQLLFESLKTLSMDRHARINQAWSMPVNQQVSKEWLRDFQELG